MALTKPSTTVETQQAAAVAQAQETDTQVQEAVQQPVETKVADKAPEVEAVKEAPAVEEQAKAVSAEPTKEVVAKKTTEVAHKIEPSVSDTLSAAGFEGMILDGLSFDRIKLNRGQFLLGQSDEQIGTEFEGIVDKSVALFLFRRSDAQDEEQVFYSYDPKGETTTSGADTSATFAEWAADGYDKPVVSQYMECIVTITKCVGKPELVGEMVICQIAPASVRRISGHFQRQGMKLNLLPNEYVTKFSLGAAITKGRDSYNPWAFSFAGLAEDAAV